MPLRLVKHLQVCGCAAYPGQCSVLTWAKGAAEFCSCPGSSPLYAGQRLVAKLVGQRVSDDDQSEARGPCPLPEF